MRKWIATLAGTALGLSLSAGAWACNTSEGAVTVVDSRSNTVSVTKQSCGSGGATEVVAFKLKKDTKITINGKEATLADLRNGDKVRVDYERTDDVLRVMATRTG